MVKAGSRVGGVAVGVVLVARVSESVFKRGLLIINCSTRGEKGAEGGALIALMR